MHASEVDQIGVAADTVVLNNGTIDDLLSKVDLLLTVKT